MTKFIYNILAPRWCKEVLLTRTDAREMRSAYIELGMRINPKLSAVFARCKDNKYTLTLDDQKIIARSMLADVAAQLYDAMRDEMLGQFSADCADSLKRANKSSYR